MAQWLRETLLFAEDPGLFTTAYTPILRDLPTPAHCRRLPLHKSVKISSLDVYCEYLKYLLKWKKIIKFPLIGSSQTSEIQIFFL